MSHRVWIIIFLINVLSYCLVVTLCDCACVNPKLSVITRHSEYFFTCFKVRDYTRTLQSLPKNATMLAFYDSTIPTLHDNCFSDYGNLHLLIVLGSGVEKVEDDAFNNLSQLKGLYLIDNELKSVSSTWFRELRNLRRLLLRRNAIVQVDRDLGRYLPNLEYLDLEDNRLICLDSDFLNGLSPKLYRFNFLFGNPVSYVCQYRVLQWLGNGPKRRSTIAGMKHTIENSMGGANFTGECINEFYEAINENELKHCVEGKFDKTLSKSIEQIET